MSSQKGKPKPQRLWTKEEEEFLEWYYGKMTTEQIQKSLGRSRASVNHKLIKMGLVGFFDASDELSQAEVSRLLHRSHKAIGYNWAKRGLKFRKVGKFRMISEKALVKFMYENQDLWDATDTETYFFEYYPWFHEKLLKDREKNYKKRIEVCQ